MTTADRIRERKICEAAIQIFERSFNAARGEGFSPEDQSDRYGDDERVEWVQAVGARQLAIEVTLVEAIPSRRTQVAHLKRLFEPLRETLEGRLPVSDIYELVIAPGALSTIKNRDLSRVRDCLGEWILRNAPSLGTHRPNHFVRVTPPGVGFEVGLYRFQRPRSNGVLRVVYSMPDDLWTAQRIPVRKALKKKLPKLGKWHAKGAVAVLIAETRDIALSDEYRVAEILLDELQAHEFVLDDLFIFDTSDYWWIAFKVDTADQPDWNHLRKIATFDEGQLKAAGTLQ